MMLSKKLSIRCLLGIVVVGYSACAAGEHSARADAGVAADTVVTGAAIYTVDACRSWAQAMAVKDGKIIFVGCDKDALPYIGPKTVQLKLTGEMVVPGFHDCHVHPVESGIEQGTC